MKSCKSLWMIALLMALIVIFATSAFSVIVVTPIDPKNPPLWKPKDLRLFSAPFYSWDDDPQWLKLMETMHSIFPEPYHGYEWGGGVYVTPGLAHPPPYDKEVTNGLKALGIPVKDKFTLAEYSFPNGVYLVFMTVPNTKIKGLTPDGYQKMMPNSMYPMHWDCWEYCNGQLVFDTTSWPPEWQWYFPPPVTTLPGFELMEGYSHWPGSLTDAADFYPDIDSRGKWEYRLRITEAGSDRGWWIIAKFEVK